MFIFPKAWEGKLNLLKHLDLGRTKIYFKNGEIILKFSIREGDKNFYTTISQHFSFNVPLMLRDFPNYVPTVELASIEYYPPDIMKMSKTRIA